MNERPQQENDFVFDAALAVVTLIVAVAAYMYVQANAQLETAFELRYQDQANADITIDIDDRNRVLVNGEPLDPSTSVARYIVDQDLKPRTAQLRVSKTALSDGTLRIIRALRKMRVATISVSTVS